jgi:hypothetical protein
VTQYGDRTWDIDGNVTYSYTATPSAAQCTTAATNLTAHVASYNSTILSLLASQRLGDLRTTGKFAQRLSVANTMRTFLNNNYPELVRAIYVDSTGADASDPAAASLDALTSLFVDSSLHLVTGAPASLALYRRRLTGVSVGCCLQYSIAPPQLLAREAVLGMGSVGCTAAMHAPGGKELLLRIAHPL